MAEYYAKCKACDMLFEGHPKKCVNCESKKFVVLEGIPDISYMEAIL